VIVTLGKLDSGLPMSLQYNRQILNLQNLQLHILYLYSQKKQEQAYSTMPSHGLKTGKTKASDKLMARFLEELSARYDKSVGYVYNLN